MTDRATVKAILAPSDLSLVSLTGVIEAATLARTLGAKLIVMTAIPQRWHEHPQYLNRTTETIGMGLNAWFAHHVPAALRDGLSVRFLTVVGPPEQAILKTAETEGADLIVMTERPQSSVDRLFHKSTTEAIARRSMRPVIRVRPDRRAGETNGDGLAMPRPTVQEEPRGKIQKA